MTKPRFHYTPLRIGPLRAVLGDPIGLFLMAGATAVLAVDLAATLAGILGR